MAFAATQPKPLKLTPAFVVGALLMACYRMKADRTQDVFAVEQSHKL